VLLGYYLDFYSKRYKMPVRELGQRLRKMLVEYAWMGNVRELAGYVERLYAANLPPMPPSMDLWDDGYSQTPKNAQLPPADRMALVDSMPLTLGLAKLEARAIRKALELSNYNRSAAAKMLEIHRSTLLRKIRALGLEGNNWPQE